MLFEEQSEEKLSAAKLANQLYGTIRVIDNNLTNCWTQDGSQQIYEHVKAGTVIVFLPKNMQKHETWVPFWIKFIIPSGAVYLALVKTLYADSSVPSPGKLIP